MVLRGTRPTVLGRRQRSRTDDAQEPWSSRQVDPPMPVLRERRELNSRIRIPDRGLFLYVVTQLLAPPADGRRMRPAYRRRGAYYFITRRCTQRKFLLLSGKLTDALVT
ncbi:MAG: hypothetical protein KBG15_13390, partial [Kofleriaceae bacterium]|nr:hypothetical protein [Kofleriaceae bacterium]